MTITEMQSLAMAGESGVALENVCSQLEEYDVAVPENIVRELKDLASLMGLKVSPWIERGGHA